MKRKKDVDEPNNPYKVSRSNRPINVGFAIRRGIIQGGVRLE